MDISIQTLDQINEREIAEMQRVSKSLDPLKVGAEAVFRTHFRNVQAVIIHTFQIAGFISLSQEDPAQAAQIWKGVGDLCDKALKVLRELKDRSPQFGASELYDLTLDYKLAADQRYSQNLRDAECLNLTVPDHLFPKAS